MKSRALSPLEVDPRVSRSEWFRVGLVAVALSALAFLPYVFGYLTEPAGSRFLGFTLNAKDQNTYFMWMHQVANGDLRLRNLYTSIPHDGAMINFYFILFGAPARFFGWSLDACYQVARVCSSLALVFATYNFAALFFARGRNRWLAFAAVMFTAGFGWLTSLLSMADGSAGGLLTAEQMLLKPVDTWVPESYPFFSMVIMPHFTMALAILFITLRWMVIGFLNDSIKTTLIAGLALLSLSFVHPYDVIVLYAVGGIAASALVFSGAKKCKNALVHAAVLFGLGAPPIVYNYVILNQNPGMKAWLVQNISESPAPTAYVIGFGLPLLLGMVFGIKAVLDGKMRGGAVTFLLAWMFIVPFLLYAPVAFQRRLAIGLSAPFAIAMTYLLLGGAEETSTRRFRFALSVILAASLTSGFHLANAFRKVAQRHGENYESTLVIDALRVIKNSAERDGCVLSSFELGNAVPRFTGMATVIGSRGQTGNFDRVLADTERFYAGAMSDQEREHFLSEHRVAFIVIGPHERALGADERLIENLSASGYSRLSGVAPGVVVLRAGGLSSGG